MPSGGSFASGSFAPPDFYNQPTSTHGYNPTMPSDFGKDGAIFEPSAMPPWAPPPAPSGFDADSVSPSVPKQTPAALSGSIQNTVSLPALSALSAPSALSAAGLERTQASQSRDKKLRTRSTSNKILKTATRTSDRPSAPPSALPRPLLQSLPRSRKLIRPG